MLASAVESESLLRFPAFGPHTLQRRTDGMTLAEFRSQRRMLREPRKLEERAKINAGVDELNIIKLLGIAKANMPNDRLAKVTATASLPKTSIGDRIV